MLKNPARLANLKIRGGLAALALFTILVLSGCGETATPVVTSTTAAAITTLAATTTAATTSPATSTVAATTTLPAATTAAPTTVAITTAATTTVVTTTAPTTTIATTTIAPTTAATTTTAAPAATGDAAKGKVVFLAVCTGCHPNGGTDAGFGPNLSTSPHAIDPAYITFNVRNGRGFMPKFGTDQVSDVDLTNIIAYLSSIHKG